MHLSNIFLSLPITIFCVAVDAKAYLRKAAASGNYCGSSWAEATKCGQPCPKGWNSECPQGQSCFGGVTCDSSGHIETTNYCGSSWTEATKCGKACPSGLNSECPSGQMCFGDVTCDNSGYIETTNYCGSSWAEATKCGQQCPKGWNSECPQGQSCFGGVTCDISGHIETTNYCGSSWTEATKCGKACPSGLNSECPSGQMCFGDVRCDNGGDIETTNYCGSSWTEATKCGQPCPKGWNSECPQGQSCFNGVTCDISGDIETTNYCGSSWAEAIKCDQTCPNGLNSECPSGQWCFGGVTCDSTGPIETTNYCGTSWSEASAKCSQACPMGVNSECPSGQQCFGEVTSCTNDSPTPKPSRLPTSSFAPSIFGNHTSSPTTTFSPSQNPSQAPSNFQIKFEGIENAYSLRKGRIDIIWYPPLLAGPYSEEDVVYDIFVAKGHYDFNSTLTTNTTVEELIQVFEDEPSFEHYQVNAEVYGVSLNSSYYGELHTLLVTAELDGVYSMNTASREVIVSRSDPHIRDDVNIVGIFIPSDNLHISVGDSSHGTRHNVVFSGPVPVEAQTLRAGDVISGFTSGLEPFVRRVHDVTSTSKSVVVLTVVHVKLEEIFDKLDLDGSFGVSKKEGGGAPGSRKLFGFVCDVGEAVIGGIVDIGGAAVKAIGDFVEDAAEKLQEFFKELVTGKKSAQYTLVDMHKEWEHEVIPDYVTLTGGMHFQAKLVVHIRISPFPEYVQVGVEADYSFEALLELDAETSKEASKNYEIWHGAKKRKFFSIGPIPIEVYWQPKLDLTVEMKASLSASAQLGISVQGEAEISTIFDKNHSPKLFDRVKGPTLNPDYTLPDLEGEAKLQSSTALVLSIEAGLYEGLLSTSVGLSAGLGMEVVAGVQSIGNSIVPSIDQFDLNIEFSIPFSADAFWGELSIIETSIYNKQWPIITLPAADIQIFKEHMCSLGGGQFDGNSASVGLVAQQEYSDGALIANKLVGSSDWYLEDESNGWGLGEKKTTKVYLTKENVVSSFSTAPKGTVTVAMQPQIPPLPLKVLSTVNLESLLSDEESGVECLRSGPCSGDDFFDRLSRNLSAEFNSQIFLSQPPNYNDPPVPSTVYKFEDFMTALKNLQQAGDEFEFWLGDDCSADSQKAALVNMATFLGQAMRETIIYDACDENNWDLWRADISKEPTSPPENLPALYPMSSGCGQLGQKYAEYRCQDECPEDPDMEQTATTNAAWIGAPPPLICGPRSKYNGLGYWNSQKFCQGPGNSCADQPFYYPGQSAGVHVPVSEDDRFPEFFYTNPLPDSNGNTPAARSPESFPPTDVQGCCWWGRGVIQTTGRCNFGKLNKQLGAGAGKGALYPEIDFCKNPQAVCDGPSDLKWVAGIFFWVSDPQLYDRDGFNFKEGVDEFVQMGCADDPDGVGCDFLFKYASGIVNRGCHDPGETGCPGCVPGATCDPAHNIPERVEASKRALRALMKSITV